MESLTGATLGQALDPAPVLTTGRAWPLGAHRDETGVNLAVFSAHAESIEWCLFDAEGRHERARLRLPGRSGDIWHGHLVGAGAGLVYGLRADGAWQPDQGQRFNPAKVLLDPWAREIVGSFVWDERQFSHDRNDPSRMDTRDNADVALKARVVDDDRFDWRGDVPPGTPLADTVLYEMHVKGFSRLNPALPEALRGTYAGLAHPASIAHLHRLGVTAVNLLPVQARIDEERLVGLGLSNYWGYNTIGFFAVEPRLGCAPADGAALRREFREMVRALHAAGLEVILDVVYNHTAESDAAGPAVSFRGLDNASYYRLPPGDRADYVNDTGCGNTLDLGHPRVLQMVTDSLRHWVEDMHVDGFRFDLATVLGREDDGFSARAGFFKAVAQDPVLARVKLIAEPWDLGPGGYQVGGFPNGWAEWNDKFRDDMRAFWLRHPATRGGFTRRLCGSSDLFQGRGRAPAESINYVISHDGFTLTDLVSHAQRHNLANGEGNRDGTGNNFSFNAGVEGPSDDPAVTALRGRLRRALLASNLLAQGTPMLSAGDELGHTQDGNNNPYCQDNPITWIDWSTADPDLIAFTARVLALRRSLRPFGNRWYSGQPNALGVRDLAWCDTTGEPLQGDAWSDPADRVLGCLIGAPGRGEAPLLLWINGGATDAEVRLPAGDWRAVLDTTHPRGLSDWRRAGAATLVVAGSSLVLLSSADA